MKNIIRFIAGILFWLAFAFAVRLPLVIIGWVVVPFTDPEKNPIWGNREHPIAPKWYRPGQSEKRRDYFWRGWRNPTNNMRYWFDEPDETDLWGGRCNPDDITRKGIAETDYRFIIAGIFWEYWYQRKCKDGEFFEVRVGWKFSGVPGFGHTFQIRKGE